MRAEGASSYVESFLGPAIAPFIDEKDLKTWQHLPSGEENQAMIKASAQLLVQSLRRAQRQSEEQVRISVLELENNQLSHQIKENEAKARKTQEEHSLQVKSLQKEISDQVDLLQLRGKTIDCLNDEVTTLKARFNELVEDHKNGWKEEKTKIEDDNFEKGFNFYLTGFLANDPEYSFEKFGQETVEFIEDFKVKHAETIRDKRIELGKEIAPEDVPSKEAPSTSEPTAFDPAPVDPAVPPKDASSDPPPQL